MTRAPNFVAAIRSTVQRHGDDRWYAFVRAGRGELVEDRYTFAELDARARSVAAWLIEAGWQDRTALLLYPAGLDFLVAFLGCLYARVIAAPSPLPSEDPRGLQRLVGIARDADVRLVLTDEASRDGLAASLVEHGLGHIACVATDSLALPDASAWSAPPMGPDTVAFLQYTSGSTSEPKGVVLSHANLLHNEHAIWTKLGGPSGGTLVGWLPHYHDMGLIGLLIQPLYAALNLAITSPATFVRRPATWLELITRYRADITVAPNFGYDWLLRRLTDAQLAGTDLSSLRIAMNGAEPIQPRTLRAVCERLGPSGFRPDAWMPVYGMAEATLIIAGAGRSQGATIRTFRADELERHRALPSESGIDLVSCGKPLDFDVRIVDPDTLAELPDSEVGEIWLSGGSVASGYWRQEAVSAETFQARTKAGIGPFMRTGDLGFRHDGELYITGRLKDLIIVNGRNLYPQDLEEAALIHPAVGVAAAFTPGSDLDRVVLIQELGMSGLAVEQVPNLAERVQATLAHMFTIPAPTVLFVRRGAVAKTTSGKVRRGHMRAQFLGGTLVPVHTRAGA
ncbi:fatty acyl-AMP ligase [Phytohabitans aurantiacus]|uniref:AMP-binding protein n=1 Tax=Phytohabitans aurantiacus TaxID=3016789 RepID=A0ABQ5QRN5_9ACTN|nr:fatty acyl-AMP ligase [Phytohabitans aurantiacus]GLH96522.1 AMP-binding protein [Phytohabitans aurantiacus]